MTSAFRFSAHASRCGPNNEDHDDDFHRSKFSLIINEFWWRTRARTWDPLIKSQLGHLNQHTLRVVYGSNGRITSH